MLIKLKKRKRKSDKNKEQIWVWTGALQRVIPHTTVREKNVDLKYTVGRCVALFFMRPTLTTHRFLWKFAKKANRSQKRADVNFHVQIKSGRNLLLIEGSTKTESWIIK